MDGRFDLIVIGAGSGGIGAALASARRGLSVLLVEKSDALGGNAVRGGVHNWEPGVCPSPIPREIHDRLRAIPSAVGITTFGRHMAARVPGEPVFPGGELVVDPSKTYDDTLRRHGAPSGRWSYAYGRAHWHGVCFEPAAYQRVVDEMLRETGRVTVRTGSAFQRVAVTNGHVTGVALDDGSLVTAPHYVDATADAVLAIACGAATRRGQEGRSTFGEPGAPEHATDRVNGVSLIYRVSRAAPATSLPAIDALPDDVPDDCWWQGRFPVAAFTRYPNGDYNLNMLPTMDGAAFVALGYPAALAETRRRVVGHWRHCRRAFPEFDAYEIVWVAPALGVRESVRVVGEYTLTEHDLRAGLSGQAHDDVVAIADHAIDTHGGHAGGCAELAEPYGIPFRCMLPRGVDNLMVACRAAGFSSIAASSCRLSRTMMALGEAAGRAASLAIERRQSLRDLPGALLSRAE